jgi:pyruvate-ferredoxin/flavodoxin oxidoreductase
VGQNIQILKESGVVRAVFYGLGSDGTVGANKNSIKIIGEDTPTTLRPTLSTTPRNPALRPSPICALAPKPIRAPYLIQSANFVAVHQFNFMERYDVLRLAAPGATFLLNSPYGPDEVWNYLPRSAQQAIIDKKACILHH